MAWRIDGWICGGFKAVRADGERIFVYRRLAWEPADPGRGPDSYEFRWRGLTAGRLSAESAWNGDLRLVFLLDKPGKINEQDLMEISEELTEKSRT